jgi:hypothetical protein
LARCTLYTRSSERDAVSSNPTERVENCITPTAFSDLVCYAFRGDAVPSHFIQQTSLVVEREVSFPLGEVWMSCAHILNIQNDQTGFIDLHFLR